MKFSFELSDNIHQVIKFVFSNVVEVVLLAYYASFNTKIFTITGQENEFQAFKGLSITGSIFMMITWCLQILLIYKYQQKMLYVIFAVNTFSILILLIGAGIASHAQQNGIKVGTGFNVPLAFWFIQLCLYIMSLVNLHNFKQQEGNEKMEDKNQKKEETDDSKKQAQNTTTQANQSQVVMMGNNESQFTQQQQVV